MFHLTCSISVSGDTSIANIRRNREFVPPQVTVTPAVLPPTSTPATEAAAAIQRPSIMRQSQSLTRLRKLSESQRESAKEEAARRHITGLRRAKVPLMVYSCGGFTRCFRIARFYSTEGPPIGVTYDRNTRAALNPELNP